jgi:N-acetylmuramic acid 6-phosphate etherase
MNQTVKERAKRFLEKENEFHLGALVTEQSHPKTKNLSQVIKADIRAGIRMLQSVDYDLVSVLKRVLPGDEFNKLVVAFENALRTGHRIVFTGCGATGRLSILLESVCRKFWKNIREKYPKIPDVENSFFSVMAGGDYALIRSVEGYEDYVQFGRQQLTETGISENDVVVAITEGGETSFVIGTAWQSLEIGAKTFFVCNNPPDILARCVKRSREIIEEPRITKIYLHSGPMAIAGSTRMQAVSIELVVIGAALEISFTRILDAYIGREAMEREGIKLYDTEHYTDFLLQMLDNLGEEECLNGLTKMVELEEKIYRKGARVTYFAHSCLLDIFTDTTERAPTFSLPPFRKFDDMKAHPSWAFVKDPLLPTIQAWQAVLGRPPRCIEWDSDVYKKLDAPISWQKKPLKLGVNELMRFQIGNENDPSRYEVDGSVAILVLVGKEGVYAEDLYQSFKEQTDRFTERVVLLIGTKTLTEKNGLHFIRIPCRIEPSLLNIWEHLAVKLVFNTISTATMALMGRIIDNWMVYVEVSNKKLIDRGIRLISELTGIPYADACYALYETIGEMENSYSKGHVKTSPVALTIQRILSRQKGDL